MDKLKCWVKKEICLKLKYATTMGFFRL